MPRELGEGGVRGNNPVQLFEVPGRARLSLCGAHGGSDRWCEVGNGAGADDLDLQSWRGLSTDDGSRQMKNALEGARISYVSCAGEIGAREIVRRTGQLYLYPDEK
jgi:hypothetical protein